MKTTFKLVYLMPVILIALISACESTGNSVNDGTLSVSISEAEEVDGDELFVRVVEHDGDVNDEEDELSQGRSAIEGGNATVDFEGEWQGTDGESYDLYVFVIDGEGKYTHVYDEYPHAYAQDGDYILETTLDDYKEI